MEREKNQFGIEQLTEEEAIALYKNKEWESWTDEQIVRHQLFQNRLCVGWSRFHKAIGKVLDRPVYTHEFAGDTGQKRLVLEYLGEKEPPTFEEILGYLPKDKTIVLVNDTDGE